MNIAIITVCLDGNSRKQIDELKEHRFNQVVCAHFDAYISAVKRPSIPLHIKNSSSLLAVVDFDGSRNNAIESVRYLKQVFGDRAYVVALAQKTNAEDILVAMRAGCREYLTKPLNETELLAIWEKVEKETQQVVKEDSKSAVALSFMGAKGGVGTTTLGVHLATYLSECHGKKTLFIDLRREMGHACVYLGIDGSGHHFQELVRNIARLDSDLLHGFVARHASGIDVLSSPDTIGGSRALLHEEIAQAVDFLRGEYDYMIADLGECADSLEHSFLKESSSVYLVSTPEIGAIRDLSRCVDRISMETFLNEKLQLVINRHNAAHAISAEQIEKAIKLPIAIKVPNAPDMVRSENLGETLSPRVVTPMTTAIRQWAEQLAGPPCIQQQKKKRHSLFGALRLNALTQ